MITDQLTEKVLAQAVSSATHSWEYGIVFEALLEYRDPKLSIFNQPFTDDGVPTLDPLGVDALQYVKPFIRTDSRSLCEGSGSSADPASLGIPALLFSKVLPEYSEAVDRQLDELLNNTPKHPNGAISHRVSEASIWADFIYMVPPFFAYYGVYAKDPRILRESVRQCELYRDILATRTGLWSHIVNAGGTDSHVKSDPGPWSTSNAWAAAGMARVLATIRKSSYAQGVIEEQNSLVTMIKSIIDGIIDLRCDEKGLLRNYLDEESWFGEVAGTALIAAAVFRVAVLEPETFGEKYTVWASHKLRIIEQFIDAETGIAAPVVNPLKESQRTPLDGVSPEGQAFVVLLYAAHRDWISSQGNIKG